MGVECRTYFVNGNSWLLSFIYGIYWVWKWRYTPNSLHEKTIQFTDYIETILWLHAEGLNSLYITKFPHPEIIVFEKRNDDLNPL